jgi:serine/threonine protein kinase
MDELFKKILKGRFSRIPPIYSEDLNHVIKKLINTDASMRPSCEQILTSEIVQNRLIKHDLIDLIPPNL